MSHIHLEATARTDTGKGAIRRLRRLQQQVPAVIYGGGKEPINIAFAENKLRKALENSSIYASVIQLKVGSKTEQVILKSLHRHPYKPVVLHLDLQRVSMKDILVKAIPLHFINEDVALGVQAGGIVNHLMTQVEVRCQVQDLPESIEVDMANVELDQVLHLSDLKLPANVQLTAHLDDGQHDAPVAGIHVPKVQVIEEPVVEAVEGEEEGLEAVEGEEAKEAEAASEEVAKLEGAEGEKTSEHAHKSDENKAD